MEKAKETTFLPLLSFGLVILFLELTPESDPPTLSLFVLPLEEEEDVSNDPMASSLVVITPSFILLTPSPEEEADEEWRKEEDSFSRPPPPFNVFQFVAPALVLVNSVLIADDESEGEFVVLGEYLDEEERIGLG